MEIASWWHARVGENSRRFLLRIHKEVIKNGNSKATGYFLSEVLRIVFPRGRNFKRFSKGTLFLQSRLYPSLLKAMSPVTSASPHLTFNYSSSQPHLNKLIIITASCWRRFLHLTSAVLSVPAFLPLWCPFLEPFPASDQSSAG